MKIGLSLYSLNAALKKKEMDIFSAISWVAEHGGEHLEIVPGALTEDVSLSGNQPFCKQVRKAAENAGIVLSGYTVGANFIQPTDAAYRNEIERIKKEVDTAAMLGVSRMRHDAGWRPVPEATYAQFEKDLPRLADACREIADYARPFGITTSVENHGMFVQNSERVQRLLFAVGRDNFRTTMDIGNFLCADEDPVSAVKNNIGLASFVHFKDFYIRKSMPVKDGFFETLHGRLLRGAIVGYGDIDIPAVVKVVKDSGYDSFISVEFEGWEDCCFGSELGMRILKKLFAEV